MFTQAMARLAACLGLTLLPFVATACSDSVPRTELGVLVDAEPGLRSELRTLRISVHKEGDPEPQHCELPLLDADGGADGGDAGDPCKAALGAGRLPLDFYVEPGRAGLEARTTIELHGLDAGGEVIAGARAEVTGFRKHETLLVVMQLTRSCLDGAPRCDASDEGCLRCDGCSRSALDAQRLRVIEPRSALEAASALLCELQGDGGLDAGDSDAGDGHGGETPSDAGDSDAGDDGGGQSLPDASVPLEGPLTVERAPTMATEQCEPLTLRRPAVQDADVAVTTTSGDVLYGDDACTAPLDVAHWPAASTELVVYVRTRALPSGVYQSYLLGLDLGGVQQDVEIKTRVHATQVTIGRNFGCAILARRAVQCWGENFSGQLGRPAAHLDELLTTPRAVALPPDVGELVALSSSGKHVCVLSASGAVYCWGGNGSGELGYLEPNNADTPTRMPGELTITGVALGESHSCVSASDGAVYCAGSNAFDQVGTGTTLSAAWTLRPVAGLEDATAVAAGSTHSCAAVDDGASVRCWGTGDEGQLGQGSAVSSATPVAVQSLPSGSVTQVAAGPSYSCAVVNGAAHCWGSAESGRLGASGSGARPSAGVVPGLGADVRAIALGDGHACAVRDAAAYCWGSNREGQAGNGAVATSASPSLVPGLENGVTAIAAGMSPASCAIQRGVVRCFGSNVGATLGVADLDPIGTPTTLDWAAALPVAEFPEVTDLSINISDVFPVACVVSGGDVRCFGDNYAQQLGPDTLELRASGSGVPVNVHPSASVQQVSVGARWACARADGDVRCWGATLDGFSSPTPVSVGLSNATDLSVGMDHACAIAGGNVYCWGLNHGGQLGDGTTTESNVPVLVDLGTPAGAGATAIAAGSDFSCALFDGGLKCWGRNDSGQLGDPSAGLERGTPDWVQGLGASSGVTAVAAAHSAVCAIVAGAVQCFGYELAGGGSSTTTTPTAVLGLQSGVTAVGGGAYTMCAVKDGALYCWGRNDQGQVGDATRLFRGTPVQVLSAPVTAFDTGSKNTTSFSCAVHDGVLKCWGSQTHRQLGGPQPLLELAPRALAPWQEPG